MKKTFLLDGLDCASCAAEIERKVGAIKGITGVSVSFITAKMIIEAPDDLMEDIAKKAKKIALRVEHDVKIKEL